MPAAPAAQKADHLLGGCLMPTAFVLQLVSFFASSQPALTEAQAQTAPRVAGIVPIAAFFSLRLAARAVASHYEAEIAAWLKQQLEQPK